MREQDLRERPKRRFAVTTDGDHDGPIFLAKGTALTGPDQLWVADLTSIRILSGFVDLAVILDAWSRRVVGWALSRRIDAELALAALEAAVTAREPPPGCVHRSDRGSRAVAREARGVWAPWLDGAERQPVRQRPGGELHEDAQARGSPVRFEAIDTRRAA
jgi:putative transposase